MDAVKLRKTNEICADQNSELQSFLLSLIALTDWSLVLHANPQLVHFSEVLDDKVNCLGGAVSFAKTQSKKKKNNQLQDKRI
jgi:hypothetical protein